MAVAGCDWFWVIARLWVFASALSELALPEDSMLPALMFFNLGVEIGQIAVLFNGVCRFRLAAALAFRIASGLLNLPA